MAPSYFRLKNIANQSNDPYSGLFDPSGMSQDDQSPYSGLFKLSGRLTDISNIGSNPNQGLDADEIGKMFATLKEQYSPETAASTRFNDLLSKFPQEKRPSLGRTLIASAAGFKGGPEVSQKIMDEPYQKDLTKWKDQVQPAYEAANLERQGNVNDRQLFGQMITSDIASKRNANTYATAMDRNRVAEESVQARITNAQMRDRLMRYKADHPQARFDVTGTTVKILNSDGSIEDTGIETGKMDEIDKIELQNKGRNQAAAITAGGALTRQQASGTGIFEGPDNKSYRIDPNNPNKFIPMEGAPEGVLTKPGTPSRGAAGKTNTLEQTRIEQEKMKDLYELDPTVRKYMTKNPNNGKFTLGNRPVIKEGGLIFGRAVTQKDVDEWDAIKSSIDPTYKPAAPAPTPPATPKSDVQYAPQPGGYQGPPTAQTAPSRATGVQPKSPEEARQRAIGYLITNNLPTTEANIQHAIKTGRFQADVQ